MRKTSKLLLLAMTATVALALIGGTASANRGVEVEPSGEVLVIYPELTFVGPAGGIICEVTLHGSIHRSIAKTRGALIARITSVLISAPGECGLAFPVTGLTGIVVLNVNWHLVYESFAGTLPNITRITVNLLNAQFLLDFNGFLVGNYRCLYRAERQLATGNVSSNRLSRLTAIEEEIPAFRTGLESRSCPEGGLGGTGNVEPPLTLRLI